MSTHHPLTYVETACGVRQLKRTDWSAWRDHCVDVDLLPAMYGWQLGDDATLIDYSTYASHWPPGRHFKCPYPINQDLREHVERLGLVGYQVSYFLKAVVACAARYSTLTRPCAFPQHAFMDNVNVLTNPMLQNVYTHICLGDSEAYDCIGAWLCSTIVGNVSRHNTVHAAVRTNCATTDANMAAYVDHCDAILVDITDTLPAAERMVIRTAASETYERRKSTWVVTLTSYRGTDRFAALTEESI